MSVVRQAAAITIRRNGENLEVLIVSAKKNPSHWIFPKGHVEPGETNAETAVRELEEEAGVRAEIGPTVGTLVFERGDAEYHVEHFLCRFVEQVGPGDGRAIRWCPPDAASALLTFEETRALLKRAEPLTL